MRRIAFTLTEMLIVIAIIAILAAMLSPSLRRAVDRANTLDCQNNQRQVYITAENFAAEHRGGYPDVGGGPLSANPTKEGFTIQLLCFAKGYEGFPPGLTKSSRALKIPWFNCPSDKLPSHNANDARRCTYQPSYYAWFTRSGLTFRFLYTDSLASKSAIIFLAESSSSNAMSGTQYVNLNSSGGTFTWQDHTLDLYCTSFFNNLAAFHGDRKLGMNVVYFDGHSKLIENVVVDFAELDSLDLVYLNSL